jgi:hypothetical protein
MADAACDDAVEKLAGLLDQGESFAPESGLGILVIPEGRRRACSDLWFCFRILLVVGFCVGVRLVLLISSFFGLVLAEDAPLKKAFEVWIYACAFSFFF